MGSFFVPLVVVVYVYFKISCVIAERHNKLEALNGPTLKVTIYVITNIIASAVDRRGRDWAVFSPGLLKTDCPAEYRVTSLFGYHVNVIG